MKLFILTLFLIGSWARSSVLVVGDLEGNFLKLKNYLEAHPKFFEKGTDGEWRIKDGHKLVFMGDAVDKGPGGIKIVRLLTQLKKSQPGQVSLILGNRDINKMLVYRLIKKTQDLGPNELLRLPYIKYLNEKGMNLSESMTLRELQEFIEPFDSKELRLKVIFKGMNASKAFEYLREELKEVLGRSDVNDSLVYKEFMRSMEKGGEFFEFLKLGKVLDLVDDTVFVHGGISHENYGKVPGKSVRFNNLKVWVKEMNEWARSEIINWGEDYRRGTDLLNYHAPKISGKNSKESVFYHRYSDASGNPKLPSSTLLKKFAKSNVRRAVSAHTPVGEFATMVKNQNFELIMSDVSAAASPELPLIKLDPSGTQIESKLPNGKVVSRAKQGRALLPDGYLTADGYRVVGQKGKKYLLLRFENENGRYLPKYIERSMDDIFKIGLKSVLEKGQKGCYEVFH
ncbi:MAG: hypothetical protein CME64_01170 [Halobacteriovoraceae bacterium]|nr:hypothetical protein [Halobacteriovoraceae bacterium]|tara:strand:- start:249029 stop:250393 length:1365 start_codon:yes stop_codon:yes gene_type:complete